MERSQSGGASVENRRHHVSQKWSIMMTESTRIFGPISAILSATGVDTPTRHQPSRFRWSVSEGPSVEETHVVFRRVARVGSAGKLSPS
jgi:hypothetical protein